MNFLGHLWLADRTGTSPAGAVLGDVVRGADLSAYGGELALGIRLHRRVDALTDRHRLIAQARTAFPDGARRYAGIVLDVALDHALALDWTQHHALPLHRFCAQAARAVVRDAAAFAAAGAPAPREAGFTALLLSYAEPGGIDHALRRIAARMRDPAPLLQAATRWPQAARELHGALPDLLGDLHLGAGEFLRAQAAAPAPPSS
ncbi:MAG TPA: ACP phosphodiesterase [Nevskiaceae bacterium]|nr:ACP phosphodiesterase [Nevskiaceae bacterium]